MAGCCPSEVRLEGTPAQTRRHADGLGSVGGTTWPSAPKLAKGNWTGLQWAHVVGAQTRAVAPSFREVGRARPQRLGMPNVGAALLAELRVHSAHAAPTFRNLPAPDVVPATDPSIDPMQDWLCNTCAVAKVPMDILIARAKKENGSAMQEMYQMVVPCWHLGVGMSR